MSGGKKGSRSDAGQASKLAAVLDSAVDAIIAINSQGLIETVNRAAERLFQYSSKEFIGQNVKFLMPEPFRSEHDGYLRHYRETGDRMIIGIGREVMAQRKDGSQFPIHLSVGEFEAGGETYFTGIIHDLSERKRVERALEHSNKLEAVGQLTGGVAHDFNNLLTIIVGNLELLEMKLKDQEQRDLLTEAQEAADLGARLTERLLAFARRSHLEPEIVDLNSLVVSLTDMLHRTLGETVSLSTALSTDLWQTRVDPGQIESVIVNLAVNARDAMPDGGKLILETRNVEFDELYAATEVGLNPDDYVQLTVSDTGRGISDEIRERVFEPFFTTKEVGRGTGLGLSMVYGFAKQSNGHVSIYSETGKGTSVNLYLPRHREADQPVVTPKRQPKVKASVGEVILVVEDNSRVRRLTLARLQELGYRVLESSSGPEALEVLDENETIDLIFSDLVMPGGMSGYDLCDEVRQRRPGIKVLLTSGYAEKLVNAERPADKQIKVLRKPYRQADLEQSVREALNEA